MAIIGSAFVQVRPDTASFEKEASGRIGGALKKVAVVAAAAFAASGAKEFLSESVQGYRDHNKLLKVTQQVIKTTGGAAKVSAKDVGALADAIERKTGVDGDAIQSGANLLLTFTNVRNEVGKGNDIFNRATGLVADMAVALGQDAKGSAIQLGKALNDPVKGVTALSRVGVSFDEQQKKAIETAVKHGKVLDAQKIILKELSKEFGGAAAAQVDNADRQTVAYHALQDTVGAQLLPVMDKFHGVMADTVLPVLTDLAEKKGPAVAAFFSKAADGTKVFLQALTGNSELDEFDGHLRTLNNLGVNISDFFHTAGPGIKDFFAGLDLGSLVGDGDAAGKSLSSIADSSKDLLPLVKQLRDDIPSLSDTLSVGATVFGFLADHTDLLAKALPFLAGGFIAVKVAQAAANAAAVLSLPTKIAEVVVNRQLIASNRELVAARRAGTAATETSTAVENVSILTRARQAVATVASTVASKAAAAASKAWAATQWVLNAALTANPIGLVVVAIAALVGGLIYAYKHSETFRRVVDGAFRAVGKAGTWLWENALRPAFKLIADYWFTVVGALVHGAAKAFGWVPGIGPKLKGAAAEFDKLRRRVDSSLSGIGDEAERYGTDWAKGLARGIRKNQAVPVAVAQGTANKIAAATRRAIDSNSPSRVAASIGRDWNAGLAQGQHQSRSAVLAAANKTANAVRDAMVKAQGRLNDLLAARRDYVSSLRGRLAEAGSITSVQADENGALTTQSLLAQLRERAAAVARFSSQLIALRKLGLSKDQLDKVAGDQNGEQVASALLAGGRSAVLEANRLNAAVQRSAARGATAVGNAMYASGLDSARGIVAGLKARRRDLLEVAADMGREVLRAVKRGLAGRSVTGNALGNPYWRGGLTMVGENGRELVDLPRGSRIYDANRTRDMERRASTAAVRQGDTFIIHEVSDARGTAVAIQRRQALLGV